MPKFDARITGRRPYLSDRAPWMGEAINCMTAQVVANTASQTFVCAASNFPICRIRRGNTGITIPSASTSSTMVMKMKTVAARRGRG